MPRIPEQDSSQRVSAHLMASAHDSIDLANLLRQKFGAGSVQVFGEPDFAGTGMLLPGDIGLIDGVVHLSAPATGKHAPHGSPPASAFFFTGSKDADADNLGSSACVSVWWGAEPSFEDSLLRDLRAAATVGRAAMTRAQQLDRLSIPRAVMKWQLSETTSELAGHSIVIDGACDMRSRVLDQLSFSHALQRHMKLLVLEEEMERTLSSVKRIVRQGLGRYGFSMLLRFVPQSLGGADSGATTMTRLLLMREFNFDDSIMTTPDWLWEQPAREAMYDAMVSEYEIIDRIEAINQQLDYAVGTMQSLKSDAHHQHSTFLEYTIVFLIALEVLVEVHALGWIEWPEWVLRLRHGRQAEPAVPVAVRHGSGSERTSTGASAEREVR